MNASTTGGRLGAPSLLKEYFLRHLVADKGASTGTIEAYRDTFRLFFQYASARLGRQPSDLVLGDLAPRPVLDFLDWLERERHNSVRTRNARLAAIKSFLRYASFRDPAALPEIQGSLAIPVKRWDRPMLGYLTRPELDAILAVCDRATWSGERDYVLLTVLYNTGVRVAEAAGLRVRDVQMSRCTTIRIIGKGRKERRLPLWPTTARVLADWLKRLPSEDDHPVFPNRWGGTLSRSGVEKRLARLVELAAKKEASLVGRRVSPHTFRHTTAMHMLEAGEGITTIALYLGHESPSTTHQYVQSSLAMKERALQKLQPAGSPARYNPGDRLLEFLEGLCRATNNRGTGQRTGTFRDPPLPRKGE